MYGPIDINFDNNCKYMEKITYDIVFNLKNNPSSSLREINKVLIDIQRNTQNIASVVTTQMSMMQNPIDEARSKWLGLTKDTGAFFAVFSENSSGILLLITMYEKLEKLGATTKIASVTKKGKVVGKKKGKTKIRVSCNGLVRYCKVTVK